MPFFSMYMKCFGLNFNIPQCFFNVDISLVTGGKKDLRTKNV